MRYKRVPEEGRNEQLTTEFSPRSERQVMFAFLKRMNILGAAPARSRERILVEEFDALDVQRRDLVCQQLDRLWTWLLYAFDGPAGFLSQSSNAQSEFLGKLEIAEERSHSLRQTESGAYYYSAAMLVLYLRGIQASKTDPDTLTLSARVAWGVNRGRELRHGY
jgi:hypothetical protein